MKKVYLFSENGNEMAICSDGNIYKIVNGFTLVRNVSDQYFKKHFRKSWKKHCSPELVKRMLRSHASEEIEMMISKGRMNNIYYLFPNELFHEKEEVSKR